MLFLDPAKFELNFTLRIAGLVFGLIGTLLFILSSVKKKNYDEIKKPEELITSGVYRYFRHPMHVGIILIHLGFPLFATAGISLASAALFIPQILIWRYWGEKDLIKKLGKIYLDCKKRTIF
jgi:protein-S-isoprenylcysteine O-methyltransferase Ste14